MQKIKKGDEIVVTTGKDKGRRGTVLKVFEDTVLVEGINIAKKHRKGNPNQGIEGGIVPRPGGPDEFLVTGQGGFQGSSHSTLGPSGAGIG